MKYKLSLVIFHRDFRLEDNTALNAAFQASDVVCPCFIIDPRQIQNNPYRSDAAIRFLSKSLEELDQAIRKKGSVLSIFIGNPGKVLGDILKQTGAEALFFNRDYTPFSLLRDEEVRHACQLQKAECHVFDDILLHAPEQIRKDDGSPYKIFTPFFRRAASVPVSRSAVTRGGRFSNILVKGVERDWKRRLGIVPSKKDAAQGGRTAALRTIQGLKDLSNYARTHDVPSLSTSMLSAHLKFGTVSIREVHHAISKTLGGGHPLIRQLFWRDFFSSIAVEFPYVFGHAFHRKYDSIKWSKDKDCFQKWCSGTTGFPIVDAGMRELNTSGFMHNRIRMVVASFLVKDLHIDWRQGERYFASRLVDYDPAVNNGNWQWSASTGCDAQPYFRIFNPWLQQKRFDPHGFYIKRWIPELKDAPLKTIHGWDRASAQKDFPYPVPICDHRIESVHSLRIYQQARSKNAKE